MASQRMGVVGLVLGLGVIVAGGLFLVLSDPSAPQDAPPPDTSPEGIGSQAAAPQDTGKSGRTARARKPGGKYAATILGEVRIRKGDVPAVGQEVVVRGSDASDVWTAESDENGAFRVEGLPPGGPYELSVTADKFATVVLPGLALDKKEQRDVGTLTLDGAVSLTVHVRSYSDQPIEGATLSAYANASTRNWGMNWMKRLAQIGIAPVAVTTTTTDAEGNAIFPKLAAGRWTIVATKGGHARAGKTTGRLTSEREPAPVTLYMGKGNSLSGQVLDQNDEPIANALVMAGGGQVWDLTQSPVRARSETDEQGHYAFADLPSGDTTLWAGRPGGVPVQVAKVRVPAVDSFDLHIRAGGVLTGTVTDADSGEPVPEAEVRAQSWSNGWRVALATTDAEGTYTMDTLLEGAVNQLTVEKDGYAQVIDPSQQSWSQIALNFGDVVERNLELRKAAGLRGRVVGPAGKPLSGANITAMGTSGNGQVDQKQATTDGEGRYEFAALRAGKWLLQVNKPGYYQKGFPQNAWMLVQQGNGPAEFTVEVPAEGQAEKDVALATGLVVEGRVEDLDGQPVAGARITGFGGGQISAHSADDGTFSLKGYKPGANNNVTASKDGYVAATETVNVLEDEPTTDVVLRLHPTPVVRGVVTSSAGGPLDDAYVQVRVVADNPNQQPWQMQQQNQFDWSRVPRAPVLPDGSYEIEIFGKSGKFTVRAIARGHEARESEAKAIVEGTLEYEANIQLTHGYELSGRVVAKGSTAPVGGATVSITRSRPQRVTGRMGWATTSGPGGNLETVVAVADAQGNFKVHNLSEGAYDAKAEAEGYVKSSKKFKLPGAGTVTVEIDPALQIAGKVRFADGTPVIGAMVAAQRGKGGGQRTFYPGGGGQNTATTGSDGSFVIRRLTEGQYTLNVTPPWGADVNLRPTKMSDVAAGRTDVDVVAEPGLTITGKILGPDRKPLAGIQVNAQLANPTPGNWVYRWARSHEDGTFEINGLVEGEYNVNVQTQWSGAADLRAEQKEKIAAGTRDLEIALSQGLEISGKVVDDGGKPKAGLMIMAQKLLENGGTQWTNNQATTDSSGRFTLRGLATGDYRLNIQNQFGMNGGGGGILRGGEKVAAGSTGLSFTVTDGLTITGDVVDGAGKPVVGAQINAHSKNGGMWKNAVTDANGEFTLKGLAEETEYNVTAQKQGLVNDTKSDVMAGSTGVRLTLTKGFSISGRFEEGAGNMDASGMVLFRHKGSNAHVNTMVDGEGNFTAHGLAEGEHTILVFEQTTDDDGNATPGHGRWVEAGTAHSGDENVVVKRP